MFKKDTETLRRYLLMALIAFTAIAAAVLLHQFGPSLLRDVLGFLGIMLFPFVFAWIAAVFLKPSIMFLHRRLHLPETLAVLLMMLICLAVLGVIITALVLVVVDVAGDLRLYLSEPDNSFSLLLSQLQEIYARWNMDFEQLQQWLDRLGNTVGTLAGQGVGIAVNIAKATPTVLIIIIVTLVATFYWCRDERTVKRFLTAPFPKEKRQELLETYDSFSRVVGKFLRAQLLLVTVSIITCVAGLSIMRIPSALPMGLLAGVLDIIPMLGPGTVLIPWAIWMALSGKFLLALGLFVLFVSVILIRNIIQPKILGDQVGLHPLVALAALFLGMELFGAIGLLMGPLVAALVAVLLRAKRNRGQ